MNKRVITGELIKKSMVLSDKGISAVYRLRDGSILKVFSPEYLHAMKLIGVDFEKKILDAKRIPNAKEILIPTAAAYMKDHFLGYTMPQAKGINYNKFDDRLSLEERMDLEGYAKRHHSIESVLVRAKDVVFPDLGTCDNIFFDEKLNPQFIDYDGLQVGKYQSHVMSLALGRQEQYYTPKYWDGTLFNKNLDKRSSIFLYFVSAFNVNLATVGRVNPYTGEKVTVDTIFEAINLDDQDVCHKVWKLFQENEENEFLRDDVFRIAEKYDMIVVARRRDGLCVKKLIKK